MALLRLSQSQMLLGCNIDERPGLGCSKLTTSLVNVLLKFQTLISDAKIFG